MLHIIKKVEYLEGYKLSLLFNDGRIKVIDFEHRLKNAKNLFLPLKNLDYFKKVKADGTTIVWPNGLDLCPDVLYEVGEEVQAPSKTKNKTALKSSRKHSSA